MTLCPNPPLRDWGILILRKVSLEMINKECCTILVFLLWFLITHVKPIGLLFKTCYYCVIIIKERKQPLRGVSYIFTLRPEISSFKKVLYYWLNSEEISFPFSKDS